METERIPLGDAQAMAAFAWTAYDGEAFGMSGLIEGAAALGLAAGGRGLAAEDRRRLHGYCYLLSKVYGVCAVRVMRFGQWARGLRVPPEEREGGPGCFMDDVGLTILRGKSPRWDDSPLQVVCECRTSALAQGRGCPSALTEDRLLTPLCSFPRVDGPDKARAAERVARASLGTAARHRGIVRAMTERTIRVYDAYYGCSAWAELLVAGMQDCPDDPTNSGFSAGLVGAALSVHGVLEETLSWTALAQAHVWR